MKYNNVIDLIYNFFTILKNGKVQVFNVPFIINLGNKNCADNEMLNGGSFGWARNCDVCR